MPSRSTSGRRAGQRRHAVTADEVRAALACVPADVDHDERVRLAFAVYDGLGDAGAEIWLEWAARRAKTAPSEDRATWKSARKPGGVTVGTLFGLAKAHGFAFPKDDPGTGAARTAEHERLRLDREQKQEAEEERSRMRAAEAARKAAQLWGAGSDVGTSPYLADKRVRGHGVRYQRDGALLVPMRDPGGQLLNVQRIVAAKDEQGRYEKRYLAGGRKSGLCHWLGTPQGADVLLLAEGYATAATLHEATGRPVAVAFDAGNLGRIAESLREQWSAAAILVCGDDDHRTQARIGKNPGRERATNAARVAARSGGPAAAVFPKGLQGDGTDFNDLACAAGAAVVCRVIEDACAQLLQPSAEPGGSTSESQEHWDAFAVNAAGVWHTTRDVDGKLRQPERICARLIVSARTRADDANGWGYLLQFEDPDGNPKTWAMPSAMLSGDGAEWAGRLRDMGLAMAPGTRARNLVARYIDTRNPSERVTCTDRVGWHGPVYVLPSCSIGAAAGGPRYVFQSESGQDDNYRRSGSLDDWRDKVSALCVGNSRLVFAVCCALAGPMLRWAGVESGGVHFRGDSSQGKTTALRVAASVWGRPSYMQRWRSTDNALEATAVQHNDCTLILDELGQLDPRVAGECAYMLANGQEKGRATRAGFSRKRRTWQLLFLSSGEVTLAQHMESVAKTPRAGQEVRMLDLPLDAGSGMGGLEVLHGYDGPAALADALVHNAAHSYGAPGRAWLEWACVNHRELPGLLGALVEQYREEIVPRPAAEQIRRAGTRFALIAAAGELATRAGVTGWKDGHARWAARRCFDAWLAARGHTDNAEDAAMLRQVVRYLELHGEGRFTWWHRALDDRSAKTLNRAGFRRLVDAEGKAIRTHGAHLHEYGDRISTLEAERANVEFLVLRETFRGEVCQGFDPDAVARLLQRRGHLHHEPDRLTVKHRLPGIGRAPCYEIKPSVFDDDLA